MRCTESNGIRGEGGGRPGAQQFHSPKQKEEYGNEIGKECGRVVKKRGGDKEEVGADRKGMVCLDKAVAVQPEWGGNVFAFTGRSFLNFNTLVIT